MDAVDEGLTSEIGATGNWIERKGLHNGGGAATGPGDILAA